MPTPIKSEVNTKKSADQAIAQSSVIAISDATDNLRNMSSIGATAIAVALSQFIETGDKKYLDGIDKANDIIEKAITNFSKVGNSAKSNIKN